MLNGNKFSKREAKLFIIPTPIGNLEDITLRAIRVLKESDMILAEDTRTSSLLLKRYEINTPMTSHHKYNEHKSIERIAEKILSGSTISLISDAGTPGISDPGFLLVRHCLEMGIEVETLPGATAFVPALINSGFPCDRFRFEGFLPIKKGRHSKLEELASESYTTIIYESPYRVLKTLLALRESCGGERMVSVSRELTKLYEENRRGTLTELIECYSEKEPKGEIVIVLSGCGKNNNKDNRGERRDEEREDDPFES